MGARQRRAVWEGGVFRPLGTSEFGQVGKMKSRRTCPAIAGSTQFFLISLHQETGRNYLPDGTSPE